MKVHTQRIFIVSFIFSQERIFKMWIGPTRSDHAIDFGSVLDQFLLFGQFWLFSVHLG